MADSSILDQRTYDKWYEAGLKDGAKRVKKVPFPWTLCKPNPEKLAINRAYETGYDIGRNR